MRLLSGLLGLVLLFSAQPGDKASISDLRLAVEGRDVFLSFGLEIDFSQEMIDRIESGLPTGFDFEFLLAKAQRRWWWFDRDFAGSRFQVVAMYNAVTRDYLVNYKKEGELIESLAVRDLDELRLAMTRFERILAFSAVDLPTDRPFQVRVRAEVGSKNLFSLIPTTLKTDWVESRHFRLPPES